MIDRAFGMKLSRAVALRVERGQVGRGGGQAVAAAADDDGGKRSRLPAACAESCAI